MFKLDYDATGLNAKIKAMSLRQWDLRPIWGDVHRVFTQFIKQHFASQGGYVGEPWVPLNPGYAAWKARNYGDKPMLRLTDRLYESLVDPKSPEHVYNVGPSFVEMGTSDPIGWYHQKGTKRGLPVRKVIPKFTREEGERIVDILLAFVLRLLRGGSK